MSSVSLTLWPSSECSSFALTKFEGRSLFSSLSSEDFRSLIDSNKYDCSRRLNSQPRGTNTRPSS